MKWRSPRPPAQRRRVIAASFISALLGGVVLWVTFFDGLGHAALPLGIGVTLALVFLFARRAFAVRPLLFMVGYASVFAVITWPVLWLGVGYARYLLTGQALGN